MLANYEIIHGTAAAENYTRNNVARTGTDNTQTSTRDNVNTDWRTQNRLEQNRQNQNRQNQDGGANTLPDPYTLLRERGIPQTLTDAEINAANQVGLQMMAGGNTSVNNVINYVKNNGKLPDNYITKDEAKKLGWNPKAGNLDIVAPGKAIGGDVYKNRNKALPVANGRIYYEADLNYNGGFRGQDRLIYSNDGLFFTTSDHYQTFTQIGGNNK